MARSKREKARAKPRRKPAPKKPAKKPHKLTFSERLKKAAKSLSAAAAPPRTKKRASPKAAPKARQKTAQKAPQKPRPAGKFPESARRKALAKGKAPAKQVVKKSAPKRKRQKKLSKAYEKRLHRAGMVAEALGLGPEHIRPIARGHARRDQGEIGLSELAQLRQVVRIQSPGQAERAAVDHRPPDASEIRQAARQRVAELAGLTPAQYQQIPTSTAHTRMSPAAERFAEIFVALGLGDTNAAYTLWFSP